MIDVSLVGSTGHIVSAFLFAGLALWAVLRPAGGMRRRGLAGASLVTVLWSSSVAVHGDAALLSSVLESGRNGAWLAFMLLLLLGGQRDARNPAVVALYVVLGAVCCAEVMLDISVVQFGLTGRVVEAFNFAQIVLRMTLAVGALVLVHNLYTAAAPEARWGIRLPMIALAIMWTYDLNLYTIAYLTRSPATILFAFRGLLMCLLAGVLALGSRHNTRWKMRLSRAVAFQTLSLMAIGGYLVMMVLIVRALDLAGFANVQLAQITAITGMTMIGILLLPSPRLRAWLRVKLIKHFFKHRYDYRAEWLRFTETLGRPDKDAAPLAERVVKAIADITESPGGLLLVPDDRDGLTLGARWGWSTLDVPAEAGDAAFVDHLRTTGRIIEFDMSRRGGTEVAGDPDHVPAWMLGSARVWAAVPLIHFDRLVGLVVLERPLVGRLLDWEDFDLLRVAGRQVASYLAEARGQEELSEAKRFDEFNRRFAFIMHDIKNLVSQLALVARNAERHADKPEFRADMVATLKSSVSKMNDLLARLSQHSGARTAEPVPASLRAIAASMAVPSRVVRSRPKPPCHSAPGRQRIATCSTQMPCKAMCPCCHMRQRNTAENQKHRASSLNAD